MYNIKLGKSGIEVPTIAVGCMRIADKSQREVEEFIDEAMSNEAIFFDHADIYGRGESERVFGKALTPSLREKMLIQTKCGIVPGRMFDFSYEHIISSVNGSLERLGTDYIDVLLLHRPDALVEPCEVARAFDELKSSGKVRYFGVSNQNPYQIELLQNSLDMPLVTNQLQLSIMHAPMLQSGINVNMYNDSAINRDGGIFDYCRLKNITVQAWSPVQHGFFKGCFIDDAAYPELNKRLQELSEQYKVSKTTIAIAWILRHPARLQVVTGTTRLDRLRDCFAACDVVLSREEWYSLYLAAGNILP